MKLKQKAWKEYTVCKTQDNYKKYACQRNKTSKIRKARQEYENRITDSFKQAPKKLYGYIRAQQKVRAAVGPLRDASGSMTETDQEVAEVLQSFFKSVFTEERSHQIPVFPEQVGNEDWLTNIDFTPEMVLQELRKLNQGKASGPDGMSSAVLNACADQLAAPLCMLFNKVMTTGQLPQEWKKATVVPIFKKGNRCEATNQCEKTGFTI